MFYEKFEDQIRVTKFELFELYFTQVLRQLKYNAFLFYVNTWKYPIWLEAITMLLGLRQLKYNIFKNILLIHSAIQWYNETFVLNNESYKFYKKGYTKDIL